MWLHGSLISSNISFPEYAYSWRDLIRLIWNEINDYIRKANYIIMNILFAQPLVADEVVLIYDKQLLINECNDYNK